MKSKSLYIASMEPKAGKLLVTMGIMEILTHRIEKVAFFRPVIDESRGIDNDIGRNLENLGLQIDSTKNNQHAKSIMEIQSASSRIKILVIPTHEELEIAEQTIKLVK